MMKYIGTAGLIATFGSAAHANVPHALSRALDACCSILAACCEIAMACCR